jgi:serine/threonine-protein kinase
MTSPRPTPGSPATEAGAQGPFRLPPKLLEDAANRICWLSLFVAVAVIFTQVLLQVSQPGLAPILSDPVNRLVTLTTVLMAVGLFALGRYRVAGSTTLIALGMVFEVVVALSISMIETSVPIDPSRPVIGMSTLGPWIVLVGVLIPNRPIWTLVTALAAASTWPVAYEINAWRFGFEATSLRPLLGWPTMNYLLAIVAYAIGRRAYGTTVEAQTAQELGSYRLATPIGQGGMGEVWKATHRMLAREAAIKLVRPETLYAGSARQAEVAVKRFKREANIIASLQSPHTVYLYDFGVSQDGRFYYVMELLDGISLQTLVTHFGPQPVGRVGRILRQMCDSLEEAHRQGLVHRDLKPSNLMLCKVALHYDFVKILDFGLAKHVGRGDITQLTMDGMASGTPGYIAPEIAMGDDRIDARADLYALGCVAYFLLTGTLVFAEDNPMRMALKHLQSEPDRPSLRTELPIPRSFEDLVMQCLRKRPEDRPGSAMEVSRRLRDCGIPAWSEEDAAGWWERHLPPSSSLRSFARVEQAVPAVIRKV